MNPFTQLPDDIILLIFAELNIFDSWAASLSCRHIRQLFLRHHQNLKNSENIRAKFYVAIIDLVNNAYASDYYVKQFIQVPDINCLNFMWNSFSPHSQYEIKKRKYASIVTNYVETLIKNLLTCKIKQKEAILIYEFIVTKYQMTASVQDFIIYGKHERKYFTNLSFDYIVQHCRNLNSCIDFIDPDNIEEIFNIALNSNTETTIKCQILAKVCEYLNDRLIAICNDKDATIRELVISYIKLAFPINANLTKIAIVALTINKYSNDYFAKNIFDVLETSNNIELFCFAAKVIKEIIARKSNDEFYISRTLKYYHLRICENHRIANLPTICGICGNSLAEHEIE